MCIRPLLALLLTAAPAIAGPDVLVIVTDDQGWGDLSCHGNTNLRTPHLDALAASGARFDRFFVQPVCSPTRAELLTGRYHPRGGVRNVTSGGERLDLDEKTVADHFRAAGYATGCFGKWHNGSQMPYHPLGRGFDTFYGFTSGHWGDYFSPPLDHDGRAVTGKGYLADDLTDRAVAFLTSGGKPKFCLLALNTPHSPMQVPGEYWDRFKDKRLTLTGGGKEDVGHTRAALAMCENIDFNVGRLLANLDPKRETVVVYLSDNGPNGARWNDGMKGRKGSTDEGGVRSPLFVRWPGKIPPRLVGPIAGAIDLLPTLCELAGVPVTGGKPLDGVSLAPTLLGKPQPLDRVLVQHWAGRVSARGQRHRLDHTGKLFDLVADPGQATPITDAAVGKRLTDAVAAWKRDVLGELPAADDRPFPVGGAELTTLPARDGVPAGGVKRSAQAPNCSYFTAWADPAGRMTWDVEVLTPGRYRAVLHYTCPKADVGAAVELALGGAKWAATVREAHDPPARGMENDRVPRAGESYVKDFKPLSLGEAALPAGRGTLTLRATAVPGKSVADVRAVELVRLPDADPPVVKGIVYKTAGGKPLDLWLFPPAGPGPAPVVVYVHGGGWSKGDKSNVLRKPFLDVVRYLTAGGVACASIEYRLADGTAAAAVADCKDAVRFLAAHAEKYKLDPARIALFGSSAGGHLALSAGLAPDADFPGDPALSSRPAKVRAVAAFFPLTSLVHPDVLAGSNFEKPARFLPLLGGPLAEKRDLARKMSPVEQLTAAAPPLFLAHGDADTTLSVKHSQLLADAARKLGVPVELLVVKGGGHGGFQGADVSLPAAEVSRRAAAFLRKHLEGSP